MIFYWIGIAILISVRIWIYIESTKQVTVITDKGLVFRNHTIYVQYTYILTNEERMADYYLMLLDYEDILSLPPYGEKLQSNQVYLQVGNRIVGSVKVITKDEYLGG